MIHIFIGTKAQLIKMAPIMQELQNQNIEYNFIFSGQHQDTMDDLRDNFSLKSPDFILHKGKDVTSILQMFCWLVKIFFIAFKNKRTLWKNDKKGIVLNHGDTFSTLAGSLLARIHGHQCAHIESGLRSFSYLNPFPEELTRVLVFSLSNYYFCQNNTAAKNLKKFSGKKIITNGNTLYDALASIKKMPTPKSLEIPDTQYAIASIHRFENIFNKKSLQKIIRIIEQAASHIKILLIAHKPTMKKLEEFGYLERISSNPNIELRPRYDYSDFIKLLVPSEFIMTDGGSNQEECHYLGKPCLILRNATERNEGLGNNALLSKFDNRLIQDFFSNYKNYKYSEIIIDPSPSKVIVKFLKENFVHQESNH